MMKQMFLVFLQTYVAAAMLAPIGSLNAEEQSVTSLNRQQQTIPQGHLPKLRRVTNADREQAAARKAEKKASQERISRYSRRLLSLFQPIYTPPQPGGTPNYFGPEGNYANSPLPQINSSGNVIAGTGIRKFINGLAGIGLENQNDLGNYIPVAIPDTTTYPGSDYYEIAAVEYSQQLHSDLSGPTRFRGYVQLNTVPPPANPSQAAYYLGPMIYAKKDRPVRVKFVNMLPTGVDGNLFLPVDTTIMGSGPGPNGDNSSYTQNRAGIHLHGGFTPWISDGTPHQWTTPAGQVTDYPQGVSVQYVPDMVPNTTTQGTMTFYYTNQQSARLMFYHDHTFGITRLNVYAGLTAPYLLSDPVEEAMIDDGTLPNAGGNYRYGIPLIIQDKTFIPPSPQLTTQDPTWNYLFTVGSLWFPHVYMPNQNPADDSGVNNFGRWDYGPWFWPPYTAAAGLIHGPIVVNGIPTPGVPDVSAVPEAFMDTPVVNGVPYPYLNVDRVPYRFRILNICNDRSLNLQLYYAEPLSVSITNGGSGYTSAPKVIFSGGSNNIGGSRYGRHCNEYARSQSPQGIATIKDGQVTGVIITDPGSGYTTPPTITFQGGGSNVTSATAIASMNTEVKMIPACPSDTFPPYYPTMDGRAGGVPDPANSGPSMIQIGTEGGFLPNPVVLANTPIGYDYFRRIITVLNVLEHTLLLGPAERADVIIDFSKVPKNVNTVILYNDAPAPVPAFDTRLDYYTNDPDQTSSGGAPSTLAGYGPNTRTILQFRLSALTGPAFDLDDLQSALPLAYQASQPPPIVPSKEYPGEYHSDVNYYARIQDSQLVFTPLPGTYFSGLGPVDMIMQPKAIQELFELNYGRMNATLGTELPFTNAGNQTTVPLNYIDPPTEYIANNEPQLWRITHNGVDTHAIHFHLFNVQLVNRVAWDGTIRPPEPNELGWKETVRMNPLENTIVAFRPKRPLLPASWPPLPTNYRPLNPAMALGATWPTFDPLTGAGVTIINENYHFGDEYVWHCHLLGHEENDMMRPIVFDWLPAAPSNVSAVATSATSITVTYTAPTEVGNAGPVISYKVYAITDGSIVSTTPSVGLATSVLVSGLTPGKTYTFYVTAIVAPPIPVEVNGPAVESNPSLVSNPVIL